MPYEFLNDVATADVAFKASGATLEELFAASVDATVNCMIEEVESIAAQTTRTISIGAESIEMLLFQLLQEIIFYKDAEELLLRSSRISIDQKQKRCSLSAKLTGEKIDTQKHKLSVDVKAVTMHRFNVRQITGGWEATVVLDI